MNTVVVDASVAAKWFLPPANEGLFHAARQLLSRYTQGQLRFVVPDLFWAEFGNILWKAVRQRRYTRTSAEAAITLLEERKLPTVASRELLKEAIVIATSFDRTVYDGIYVALAVAAKVQLITADERLANELAAYLPVKWLGAV